MRKQDIHTVIQILEKEVQKWKMPVLGQYTRSPFTLLVACLLSLRTQDKTTDEASARLFKLAETPQDMKKIPTAAVQKSDILRRKLRFARKLPQRYWIPINDLLVTYGQNICKPISPFCSQYKIHRYCKRVGVDKSR